MHFWPRHEAFWLHNMTLPYRDLAKLEPQNPDGMGVEICFTQGRWEEAAAA
jgi:hypothetical protein